MNIQNTAGKIFYGLHFYPGLAQYQEEGSDLPYRVYLNENTLRDMDPTFAGKPIFVEHVDDVTPDLDQLRTEADGWVIESFFNSADGKHWVKFITVTDEAEQAIRSGMRLSNAYVPKSFKQGGLWNGVPYEKEITAGEYEHLAIVRQPRYEESVIMTPEEFKQYNAEKVQELKKLSNSNKGAKMKFNFFKRTQVENAIDPELQIVLPKSGKIVSLGELLQNAYEKDQDPAMDSNPQNKKKNMEESAKSHSMANMDHMVKMRDGSYMKVKDMMSKHHDMMDELADMKKPKQDSAEKELEMKVAPEAVDVEGDLNNMDAPEEGSMDEHEEKVAQVEHKEEMKDGLLENPEEVVHDENPEEDEKAKKKALQLDSDEVDEVKEAKQKNKKKNDSASERVDQAVEADRKQQAKIKADRLRNAHLKAVENSEAPVIDLPHDRVARGKARYGSN